MPIITMPNREAERPAPRPNPATDMQAMPIPVTHRDFAAQMQNLPPDYIQPPCANLRRGSYIDVPILNGPHAGEVIEVLETAWRITVAERSRPTYMFNDDPIMYEPPRLHHYDLVRIHDGRNYFVVGVQGPHNLLAGLRHSLTNPRQVDTRQMSRYEYEEWRRNRRNP